MKLKDHIEKFEESLLEEKKLDKIFSSKNNGMLQDEFGADLNTAVELYFHRTTLKEAGFYPEVGDIVDWNGFYWEMNGVVAPQLIAGHQGFNHEIKATAHRARLSSLQIEERPK